MLKKILLLSSVVALIATPADARVHHKRHHHSTAKAAVTGAVVGGAVGLAVGAPAPGAVAGAAIGVAIDESAHHHPTSHYETYAPAYPGYKYYNGYYYDGYGHRYTLDEIIQKHGKSSYRERVKSTHNTASSRSHTPPYEFAEKYGTFDYPGFTFRDGVYWDKSGNWYAPSYMYRYYGPSVYQNAQK